MVSMEENSKQVANLLKVLANQNRLLILCSLMEKPMNVGELSSIISNISQPSISQHLSVLKSQDVVDFEKNGQNVVYFIKDKRILGLMDTLKENFCK